MKSKEGQKSRPTERGNVDVMSEEEIDQSLEDTFPASDPPPWTLGTDHTPAESDEDEEDEAG